MTATLYCISSLADLANLLLKVTPRVSHHTLAEVKHSFRLLYNIDRNRNARSESRQVPTLEKSDAHKPGIPMNSTNRRSLVWN